MSRVGKLPVAVPKGVTVSVADDGFEVKGPKGTLTQRYEPFVTFDVQESAILVHRVDDTKRAKAMHGLYRNLLNNMVIGVTQGYSKTLTINGVGYRAEQQGKMIVLNLGYSNPVAYMAPDDVVVTVEAQNRIVVSGIDKTKVGQVSAEIRSLRPPEPYKGKGIRYENEHVRRKVGKSGVK